jgi:uncharacterized phage protein (TIGR01671 family)
MIDICFRAKRKDNGEWVEGYYGEFHNRPVLQDENSGQIFEPREDAYFLGSSIGGFWHIVDRETLGQFIGLIDKNGKKIFTGDIVRFHGGYLEGSWIGEVKYDGPCALLVLVGFMPCRYDSRFPSRFEVQISGRDKKTFEVIGNRWDNPEYLGEDVYIKVKE